MSLKPATPAAMQLLMKGAEVFSRMEAAGLQIDVDYLDRSIKEVSERIIQLETALKEDDAYKLWTQSYGNDTKLSSRQQLGSIVFDQMGFKRSRKDNNDAAAFEHLKLPFVRNYQELERLKKALSTNLKGIKKEVVNGYLHAFFDLHTTESYRSSSSKVNLQNQPIRNKDIARIVRSCVIPRDGHVLLEPDLETHEVRISYCYHKDSKMREDVLTGDMHRDKAKELFLLDEEPTKDVRYTAKNKFVFAQFYGSYYKQCAPELWDYIAILDLKTAKGKGLYQHLAEKGIKKRGKCDPDDPNPPKKGTYEYLVWEVEQKMWRVDYKVYNQWKEDWWNAYQQNGGFHTKTGFTLEGVFRRNQVLCDAVQGSAFHCLLWAMIQIEPWLRKKKMRTKLVSQVHDSMLFDTHLNEVEDVAKKIKQTLLIDLPDAWKWICIPLGCGLDVCKKNWFDKEPLDGTKG